MTAASALRQPEAESVFDQVEMLGIAWSNLVKLADKAPDTEYADSVLVSSDAVADSATQQEAKTLAGVLWKLRIGLHFLADYKRAEPAEKQEWEIKAIMSAMADLERMAGQGRQ